jgi:hypothetical protein
MIEALSPDPSLNTPVEAKRLEAARAAMAKWKALQPRLPSPAQRAPTAPRPPLNRIEERRARRLGSSPSGTGWRLYRRRAVHAHQDAAARPPKWQRGADGVDAPLGVASALSRPDMHERRQT